MAVTSIPGAQHDMLSSDRLLFFEFVKNIAGYDSILYFRTQQSLTVRSSFQRVEKVQVFYVAINLKLKFLPNKRFFNFFRIKIPHTKTKMKLTNLLKFCTKAII